MNRQTYTLELDILVEDGPPTLDDWERAAIVDMLKRTRGHKGHAARELGVARSTLWAKMKKYGLD